MFNIIYCYGVEVYVLIWEKVPSFFRSRASRINDGNPLYNYPQGFDNHLPNGDANMLATFSPSFVDNMRIPRAMEVKIVESVNSINHPYHTHPYSSPCLSPKAGNDYLSTEMLSSPKERVAPSRQQSLRYSNMSTEESKERIHREKMLVTELREKFRNQRKINE